jgi:protein ImuA
MHSTPLSCTDPVAPALPPEARLGLSVPGVWCGTEIGHQSGAVVPTGWASLDRELPGGGWPVQSLTEILAAQAAVTEWRLLGPALRRVAADGGPVLVIGPPRPPYLPGLRHAGLDERGFVWITAETPAERLWTTEQLIRSNACGAILAWLPHARADQIRRLQVCAQSCDKPVFLFRPAAARHESSAAPLRLHVGFGLDWTVRVHILKRRGPLLDAPLDLPSMPGGLAAILTPRMQHPGRLFSREVPAHAVGRPVIASRARRHPAIQ